MLLLCTRSTVLFIKKHIIFALGYSFLKQFFLNYSLINSCFLYLSLEAVHWSTIVCQLLIQYTIFVFSKLVFWNKYQLIENYTGIKNYSMFHSLIFPLKTFDISRFPIHIIFIMFLALTLTWKAFYFYNCSWKLEKSNLDICDKH